MTKITAQELCDHIRRVPDGTLQAAKHIVCQSGLTLSVQAGKGMYSAPREDGCRTYTEVEVGFPSRKVMALMPYAESPDTPTDTVYGYVPIDLVVGIINEHGGSETPTSGTSGKVPPQPTEKGDHTGKNARPQVLTTPAPQEDHTDMTQFTYDSNNSGGSWWLTDEDWYALEAKGWEVHWKKDEKDRFITVDKDGRWLGALATSATKAFRTREDAINEWEEITGQRYNDMGCTCCGEPHYISRALKD